MNILLLSTSYIESCICENVDLFLGIDIDSLFILKDNHANDIIKSNYNIFFISDLDEVPDGCIAYLILTNDYSENLVVKLLKKLNERKLEVYIIGDCMLKDSSLHFYLLPQININFDLTKHLYKKEVSPFKKPTIILCGLSNFNQQITLELKLNQLFKKDGINCYFVSHYQPFADESINNIGLFQDNRQVQQWILSINEKTDSSDIVCISLPFDFQDKNVYGYGTVELIFDTVCPNYTICCITREKDYLYSIPTIKKAFFHKYGNEINAFFISDYETNEAISPSIRRPLRSARPSPVIQDTRCGIYCKETINQLYCDVIKKLTLPEGVILI